MVAARDRETARRRDQTDRTCRTLNHRTIFQEIDIAAVDWLNSHHIPGTLGFMQFCSGYATWINILLILAFLAYAIFLKSGDEYRKVITLALVMIISALVIWGLKELFDRDRPFLISSDIEKLSYGGGSSFPSGHTVEAFSLAMAFSVLYRKKWITLLLFVWAAFIAYTRMALGVHFPSDIAGGVVIGISMGWLLPRLMKRWLF